MPGVLCEHCTGFCCRYIALPIETPTEASEFDDIRWYLLHEGITVFVEGGEWYLNVSTNCRHLQPDFRCGIYETRPKICRDYSTDNCDYHSGDYGWQHHFTCPEHLDDYVVEFFQKKRKPAARGRGAASRRKNRSRVRVRLGGRTPKQTDYAAATVDTRGIPLPLVAALTGGPARGRSNGQDAAAQVRLAGGGRQPVAARSAGGGATSRQGVR